MQVELTEHQESAVRRWINEGDFATPAEVLDAALRLLGKRVGKSDLKTKLEEGLDSPISEWHPAELDTIRHSVRNRFGS